MYVTVFFFLCVCVCDCVLNHEKLPALWSRASTGGDQELSEKEELWDHGIDHTLF